MKVQRRAAGIHRKLTGRADRIVPLDQRSNEFAGAGSCAPPFLTIRNDRTVQIFPL